jgi:hypothetical protein
MKMTALKKILYVLVVGVIVGSMAGVSLAYEGSGTHADEWELREAMETGALPPDRPVGSYDAACCSGIDEPTVEGGGQLFRPEIDSGA